MNREQQLESENFNLRMENERLKREVAELHLKYMFDDKSKDWDNCKCKKCGHEWNASDDEHFNITCCPKCYSDKIEGEFWKKEKKESKKKK